MKITRLLASASISALAFTAVPAIAGEITGIVVDETDTVPLQSATVLVAGTGRSVATDRDGTFRISDLPEGTYEVTARYVGAPSETISVQVPSEGSVELNFALGGDDAAQILVFGQAANQSRSLNRKYASDTVSDVITRDAIGQFPDQNVAESLRRLPGINVLNDQGEGRFVSVRGLDPSLNATSVNGVRVPAPESDTRAVALDVVSSDIIESIEVRKSLTPDMDADTIGASIEINTVSAFDRRSDHLGLRLEGSYNDLSGELRPKASLDFAYRLADNVGISGGVSFYNRFFETDNIEADDWDEDNGLIYAEEIQYRDYDVERERISASLGLDFKASDTTELYVRGLFSQFDDQEFRRRLTFDFGDADISGNGNLVEYSDASDTITIERDIKDRFERQRIWSISAGGETQTNGWNIEYMASYARSSEKEDGSVDPTQFELESEQEGLIVGFDYSDARRPLYSVIADPAGTFFDASEYGLNDVEFTELSDARDEEYALQLDIGREFAFDNGVLTLQAGAKGRWREKTYDFNVSFWELDGYTLADVQGEPTFGLIDISPVPSHTGHTEFFLGNMGSFEFQDIDSAFDSALEDYGVEENVYAGYALARWDSNDLTVIGGVRYERTVVDMVGNNVLLVEEDGTLPDGSTASDDTVIVSPLVANQRYGYFLPSLNIRFEPKEDVVLRLAGYRSLVRPSFSQLAPRFEVEENDDGEVEGSFGNPDLQPYKAWNFDASAEYYFSGNGALSLAFFYKDISDYIVEVELESPDPDNRLSYRGVEFNEATIPFNGDSAQVWGIEVGIAQQWDMLPAPFDGLITQANYTYTDAMGTVPEGGVEGFGTLGTVRDIWLPSTSEHTFNAVLGYEKGPISLRLAGTYRDDYLDELNGDPEEDRYVADHFQLDFSAKYRINDNIQIFYEWINITDAEYFAYNNVGGRQNNYQYEEYSWTMKFGARVNF